MQRPLMEKIFLKTDRFYLRYMTANYFDELKSILQDDKVMYTWEYSFTDEDVQSWIDKNLSLYTGYNLGYFLMVQNQTGEIIGQAALMPDWINGDEYYEIGYILKQKYWHKGYAAEAANALVQYAFNNLKLNEVIFEIRPDNLPSRKVAEKLGAKITGKFIKNVKGKKMEHFIYKLVNYSAL